MIGEQTIEHVARKLLLQTRHHSGIPCCIIVVALGFYVKVRVWQP